MSAISGPRPLTALRARLARAFIYASILLLAFEVGGGLYEHLVLDRAWPENPALIHVAEGGANRATFWIGIHGALGLSLLAGLWAAWPLLPLRRRLAWALGLHIAMRAWSFAYFIPRALHFESGGPFSPDDVQTWILLSPLRTLLSVVALYILFRPGDLSPAQK